MITREDLINYAKIKKLNLGQAELDYFQDLILFKLSDEGKNLIFKGGTALSKAYNLDRFSEDLDFTVKDGSKIEEKDEGIIKFLERYGVYGKIIQKQKFKTGFKLVLRLEGPLYAKTPTTLCKIHIDFSFRENVMLEPDLLKINHSLTEIPLFSCFVMNLNEIFAEKVRAIITRKKARDMYDLHYLLKRGIKFDESFVNKKLEYYKSVFTEKEFLSKLKEKKDNWERELKPLVSIVPDFESCFSEIKMAINKIPSKNL